MQRKALAAPSGGLGGHAPQMITEGPSVLVSRASLIPDPRVRVVRMTPLELHGVSENAGTSGAKAVNRSQGGTVGLHSGQTPATKILRRQMKKASIDELSVYRSRLKESSTSKLDHGYGYREDNLTGVGKRVRRTNAFGCFWVGKKGVPQCEHRIQKGLFFSRYGNENIHDLEVCTISLFWLAEGS